MTNKEYYQSHREELREKQKKYRKESTVFKESNERWKKDNRDKMIQYRAKYGGTAKGRFTKLKLKAGYSGIPIDIKQTEFIEWYKQQDFKCHYCGSTVATAQGQKKLDGYSIDRKDNHQGYTLKNIVICCNRCNMAKGSWFTEEQMMEIAHKYFNGR